jgi:hypothetical protein
MWLRCPEGVANRSSATRLARSSNAARNGSARKIGRLPLDEPTAPAAEALVPEGARFGAEPVSLGACQCETRVARFAARDG